MANVNKLKNKINNNTNFGEKIKDVVMNNIVTIIFVVLCLIGIKLSGLPIFFVANELVTRISRNSFLVLALIIPVLAGMGLNFSIVVGAMAGQIAIIAVTHWGITGLPGFLLCAVIAFPFAVLFGYLTGKLLNKTKGQEMITSMIVGYFANGVYQLVFLFLVGTIIPMKNNVLMLSSGVGIRNTIDLSGGVKETGIKYALDQILKLPIFYVLIAFSILAILYNIFKLTNRRGIVNRREKQNKSKDSFKYIVNMSMFAILLILSIVIVAGNTPLKNIQLPVVTVIVIGVLCLFNILIVKTKLGQEFRTVGQDKHIAKVAGINVDRIRVLAIVISTVLAAWGQLIFLQNIGTLNTYGSHEQIGMFSIAALLIGGASVSKATVGQAILGTALFHTLFIVSPLAGKNLFGDAQIGEFFRAFVVYGVIGVSLGLHAWKNRAELKRKLKIE
ncbi:ABC transporter permease subunit [Sporosalibacterium faouarense]|uniref:ABC transporter permease subunit n=1 Tax=Sporosalibacterium faouarense TaxID=516123 RepID=UPI001FAF29B4|nr:ABC transporter permease [Sporosalibacterium faouarense]